MRGGRRTEMVRDFTVKLSSPVKLRLAIDGDSREPKQKVRKGIWTIWVSKTDKAKVMKAEGERWGSPDTIYAL